MVGDRPGADAEDANALGTNPARLEDLMILEFSNRTRLEQGISETEIR